MTPSEEWRPIVGYEGRYEVSSLGRVRSLERADIRGRVWPAKIRALVRTGLYAKVSLCIDGECCTRNVHQLVARAFLGEQPLGYDVRHLNGNHQDNRLENLRYGTRSENLFDAVAHGTNYWARRTHCKNGHEFTPENTHRPPGRRHRVCRACAREHYARRAS